MKNLTEISQLVTSLIGKDTLNSLFQHQGEDLKSHLFIDGLLAQRWKSDEEAAQELYKSFPTEKKYQMLKSRLRKRFYDLIFSIDISSLIKTSYYREQIHCYRLLFAGSQLFVIGKLHIALEMIRSAESIARKFQFTPLRILALQRLREYQGFTGNIKGFYALSDSIETMQETLIKETQLDTFDFQFRIAVRGVLSKSDLKRFNPEQSIRQAESLYTKSKNKSHRMTCAYYRSRIYYYHLKKDHKQVLKQCIEFEHYLLRGQKFTDMALVGEIAMQKLDTSIYLQDFKTGRQSALQCDSIFRKGNPNRFIYQQYYLLLCLYTGKTDEAVSVFNEVISSSAFKKFPEEQIERWRIFEAMLNYILPDGRLRKFNVHKFLNEVPILSKDKTGFNLSIIIAQICLLVKRGDFDKIMDKFDSLKSYAQRYISVTANPRNHYFIKLLLILIKKDFDTEKCAALAEKYLALLSQSSVSGQQALDTMEIIPYDVLWNDLLKRIKTYQQQSAVK